ncbi:MAG: hypothetical protein H6907_11940 [Hyphomicrobiales bacterium]|nr:hypothetical protein [Hyphomicrobiales bacterium]MCP5372433.1 hypothetical protein [Hyphomicrobiales bacterium]
MQFRTRYVAFSEADHLAYSDLLAEAFPDARYFDDMDGERNVNGAPPAMPAHRTLADCSHKGRILFVFDPGWRPEWRLHEKWNEWRFGRRPCPNADYEINARIMGPLYGEPEQLSAGRIYFRCRRGVQEDFAFANKALRLLNKVATNRYQGVYEDTMKRVEDWNHKGNMLRIGFHALDWCRGDPSRYVAWGPGPVVYRPYD